MLWIFLLEIPTGAIADYFGRKYSLALGAAVQVIAAVLYGTFPHFGVFLLAEVLFAAAIALMSGADKALLYDSLQEAGKEKESTKLFGRAHSFELFGILVSALVGGVIASSFGLNAPMLFTAIPYVVAVIIALSMRELTVHQNVSESKRYSDILRKGFTYLYHHKELRPLVGDAILVSASAYFVIWLYQLLLTNNGIPIVYFGSVHAGLVAVEMLIAANFIFFEKWFRSAKLFIVFSALITSVAFILTAVFPNMYMIVFFIVFAGGFGLTRSEFLSAHMNTFIPSPQRATILSSISMFQRFLLVVLNPIIGYIADHSIRSALVIVGVLPLLSLLFFTRKYHL
ncbi:MAG TPA: MFS transporter [Patescibacteria group bacterium]|nr:MFS transporter [Patescibacteria group bacterium]